MFDKQFWFDRIAEHLLTQNRRCENSVASCQYRSGEKVNSVRSCAIGCIIPDRIYTNDIEGLSAYELIGESCTGKPALPELIKILEIDNDKELCIAVNFLNKMQEAHDSNEPEEWEDELKKYAKNNKLFFNFKGKKLKDMRKK